MIQKIISGGQTGADRAALDVAIKFDIPHGGYIPKGRQTEDGRLPDTYNLKELSTSSYPVRTEKNIRESDGTVIITRGILTGGSKLTETLAYKHRKPLCVINLNDTGEFQGSLEIVKWVMDHQIETLNVAGPRASHDKEIYGMTVDILETVLYLQETHYRKADPFDLPAPLDKIPQTLDEAVTHISDIIPLRERVRIASLSLLELESLLTSLSGYIMTNFNVIIGNDKLLESCRLSEKKPDLINENVPEIIIRKLWEDLKKTHKLRVIK